MVGIWKLVKVLAVDDCDVESVIDGVWRVCCVYVEIWIFSCALNLGIVPSVRLPLCTVPPMRVVMVGCEDVKNTEL